MTEEKKNISLSRDVTSLNNNVAEVRDSGDVNHIETFEEKEAKRVNEEKALQKKKSNLRVFVLFLILDLALFGVILWQIITLFMKLGNLG